MTFKPHDYQKRAIDFIINTPCCGLFIDMGLGKTVCTLTAVHALMDDYLEVSRVLVIAPKSVAQNTWTAEASKWDHTAGLRVSVVLGTAAQRRRALEKEADIYVTNRDNVVWLRDQYIGKKWPFDCVVLDESSSFKNPQSRRFKALRSLRPQIRRVIELTGTPSPNGLMDLWAQLFLLDRGERLGATLTSFRGRYFTPGRANGFVVYDWRLRPGAHNAITERISDVTVSMRAADYLTLPGMIEAGMDIALPEAELKRYRQFEKDCLLELDPSTTLEAVTAAALSNKLLQYTGGLVYDADHNAHMVSCAKLDALEDIVDAAGEPVLVYYWYQSERDAVLERLKDYGPETFSGEPETLRRWNEGRIRVLVCQPASVAYGLNMQQGGRIIIWYTMTWNLELYQQANARLYRQGQQKPVLLYHLTCLGTIDEKVRAALVQKEDTQNALLEAIKAMLLKIN